MVSRIMWPSFSMLATKLDHGAYALLQSTSLSFRHITQTMQVFRVLSSFMCCYIDAAVAVASGLQCYRAQVEVKKAEPRDIKLVADCQFVTSSLITKTTDRPGAAAASTDAAADDDDVDDGDNDNAAVPKPVTGTVSLLQPRARVV